MAHKKHGGEREERNEFKEILEILERIERLLTGAEAVVFQILQVDEGGNMGVVKGILAGGSGSFDSVNVPAGSVDPSGLASWSADSVLAVVTPSADGKTCSVAVDAKAVVGATFTLTKTAKRTDGKDCVGTVAVPVLGPVGVAEATSFDINQTA